MTVKIDDLIFDRANYDADGDVLYLARGNTSVASEAALTPEGHGVRYNANGEVIGVTIINARRIIGRDGHGRSRFHMQSKSKPESWRRHSDSASARRFPSGEVRWRSPISGSSWLNDSISFHPRRDLTDAND